MGSVPDTPINAQDFMNGDYVFNQLAGSNCSVINHGVFNASLCGNVALLGKWVANHGSEEPKPCHSRW